MNQILNLNSLLCDTLGWDHSFLTHCKPPAFWNFTKIKLKIIHMFPNLFWSRMRGIRTRFKRKVHCFIKELWQQTSFSETQSRCHSVNDTAVLSETSRLHRPAQTTVTPRQPHEPRRSPEPPKRSENGETFAPKEEGVVASSCCFLRRRAAPVRYVQWSKLTRTNRKRSLQTSFCDNVLDVTFNEGFLHITVWFRAVLLNISLQEAWIFVDHSESSKKCRYAFSKGRAGTDRFLTHPGNTEQAGKWPSCFPVLKMRKKSPQSHLWGKTTIY